MAASTSASAPCPCPRQHCVHIHICAEFVSVPTSVCMFICRYAGLDKGHPGKVFGNAAKLWVRIRPYKRAAKTQKKTTKKVVKRTRRDKWTRLLEGLNSDDTIEYKMDKDYELETAIHHEIFGIGVVKNIIDSRKIGVLFHDGEKILVQNLPPRS